MKTVIVAIVIGTSVLFTVPVLAVEQSLIDLINSKPQRLICEILPRPGSEKSYLIFHMAGATGAGIIRYRAPTTPPHEISFDSDGSIIEGRNPCISTPVGLN